MNLDVVAEGVETIEQVNSLRKYSCEKVQGYYFYRPMPRQDIEDILQKRSGL
jgi:EAL domain-containing protein (putative c-di-GMP-specific phosphodiesterase class I)